MPDDIFERVARWWDRDSLIAERRAVLFGFNEAHTHLQWSELGGEQRWTIVNGMRGIIRLADELRGVLK